MNALYCFSGAGHSRAVARFFAHELGLDIREIGNGFFGAGKRSDIAILVFPVYGQNLPWPVKEALRSIAADDMVLVATYGRMSYGNVLWEAARLTQSRVIAAACLPIGHTYLGEPADFDPSAMQPILERIAHPKRAEMKRTRKNPLAGFLPSCRSRYGVRIQKNGSCGDCRLCEIRCPVGAMIHGQPSRGCLRCLRCVEHCPRQALQVTYHPFLKRYLRKKRQSEFLLYL